LQTKFFAVCGGLLLARYLLSRHFLEFSGFAGRPEFPEFLRERSVPAARSAQSLADYPNDVPKNF
jgi:hypothetical protein